MVISRSGKPKSEGRSGEGGIKRVQDSKYLGYFMTNDGKCDSENQMIFGIAKNPSRELNI